MTSRAFEEYVAFFDLDIDALAGRRVLDCSAGAASFVARAGRAGIDAVAVDPAYATGQDELAAVAGRGLRSRTTPSTSRSARTCCSPGPTSSGATGISRPCAS